MALDAERIDRAQRWSLVAGVGALVLAALGGLVSPAGFFRAYLAAFLLVAGLPLGAAALLMVHHLTGGRWGVAIRPLLASAGLTLPLFIVLFLPLLFGLHSLYAWTDPDEAEHAHLLSKKTAYLNVPFFLIRTASYLILWGAGGWLMYGLSMRKDRSDNGRPKSSGRPARAVSERPSLTTDEGLLSAPGPAAAGLILYVMSISFAAIDWVGSLEAEWYSSIFGLYIMIGQALSAICGVILVVGLGERIVGPGGRAAADVLHDLGNLLLAMVALHAYFAFSQFFIIWNGNLPHEISWYIPRMRGGWGAVSVALIFVDFALPLAILLFRDAKRSANGLMFVAAVVLLCRVLEALWMVVPSTRADAPTWGALLLAIPAMVGAAGVWLSVMLRLWRRGPLLLERPAHGEAARA